MAMEKTDALVLRTVEFSESSLIVTLFTRDYGRISAMAKGARRAKNPFDNSLDLLCTARIVFLQRHGPSLHLLTEAKLLRRFRAGSRSLGALHCGFYVAELLRELTEEGEPQEVIYRLADETLRWIDSGERLSAIVSRFELLLLKQQGAAPSLDRCVGCDARLEIQQSNYFGMAGGGLLCGTCRPAARNVIGLRAGSVHLLEQLLSSEDRVDQIAALPPQVRGEVRGLLSAYVSHHLGHRPQMHRFLGFLATDAKD